MVYNMCLCFAENKKLFITLLHDLPLNQREISTSPEFWYKT